MNTDQSIGRRVGVLFFAQFLTLMVGFILLVPGVTSEYLQVAAGFEGRMRAGVMVLMASSALTVAIAALMYPAVRERSMRAGVFLIVATTFWVVMQTLDDVHIMSMLAISKRSLEAAGANSDIYGVIAAQVRSTRLYAHYGELLAFDVWYACFYGLLFVFRLVPRWLAAVGLATVALHLIGLPLAMFVGYPLIPELAYGLILGYFVLGGWLIVKGFAERA